MKFLDLFFSEPENGSQRLFVWALIAILFLSGVAHWLVFYNFGSFLSTVGDDWKRGYAYYAVFQQAIAAHQVPWIAEYQGNFTPKFLAVPETVLSPQILALSFLSIPQFITANNIFMYAIGFIGCLWIRTRLSLSLLPFILLFLIFNFNGHITHHLAMGQSMWFGYYLLPFFLMLVMDLVEKEPSLSTQLWVSLVLFFMFLQGSFHIVIWCLIFLGLVVVFNPKHFKPVLTIVFCTLLLSTVRLLPGFLFMPPQGAFRIFGFSSIGEIFRGLVSLNSPKDVLVGTQMDFGQYDLFVDTIGFCFLAYFGVYRSIRGQGFEDAPNRTFYSLAGPMLGMAFLSMTAVYTLIYLLPVPMIGVERMVARFDIIPVLFLLMFAVKNMKTFLKLKPLNIVMKFTALALTFLLRAALITHSDLLSSRIMTPPTNYEPPALSSISKVMFWTPDTNYALCVKIGLCISLVSLAALLFKLMSLRLARVQAEGKRILE